MIYFISDTHFQHFRVIAYCNRPFGSLREMNETLIKNWQSIVKPEDTVYFLGDFGFMGVKKGKEILSQLPGKIIALRGNHDESIGRMLRMGFAEVHEGSIVIELDGLKIRLCHYPYATWRALWRDYKKIIKYFVKAKIAKWRKHKKEWLLHEGSLRDRIRLLGRFPKRTDEDWLYQGHVHNAWGQINRRARMINVSCDVWDFIPVSQETLLNRIRKFNNF